jgi:hypothetical protein
MRRGGCIVRLARDIHEMLAGLTQPRRIGLASSGP